MKRMLARCGLLAVILALGAFGCIQTPREINVDASGWRSHEKVDTAQIPETRTHEEAKAELRKAYAEIDRLKDENAKLKRKNDELKKKHGD
jgi:hypothetical protein